MSDALYVRRIRGLVDQPWCEWCEFYHKPCPAYDVDHDIWDEILRYLGMADLARLQLASAHFGLIVAEKTSRDCESLLSAFGLSDGAVTVDEEFDASGLGIMASLEYHSSIIVGMAPLRILYPQLPMPKRLDIFCSWGNREMAYVLEARGYRRKAVITHKFNIADSMGYRFFGENVQDVILMEKEVQDAGVKEVLLVGCKGHVSPVSLLTESPCTLLMNFITGDGFYSLYPRLTADAVGLFNIPYHEPTLVLPRIPIIETLRAAGFKVYKSVEEGYPNHRCTSWSSCPLAIRSFPSPADFAIEFNLVGGNRRAEATTIGEVFWRLKCGWSCGGLRTRYYSGFHSGTWTGAIVQGLSHGIS
ncbi:hypothetical protein DFP72DRAFT_1081839 [Ephemerocybe angulata]|uniref:Uncharacterized protein n=1 Tax=Ephemerocybe angulata TaxID=980116 RepID=A0A8H6LTW6_9AGAR|nr:hypothetical protein DFP72DRAFT_1081839 [Tulosesus angulatus]